jgi:hypothetical protein
MSLAALAPVKAIEAASRWPALKLTLLRINEYLSDQAASLGKSSVKRTPGVRVAIVANGPRYSAGALGLGSKRSRWLGPPPSQTSKIDFAFGVSVAASVPVAAAASANGAAKPACRKVRRPIPWQVRHGKLPMSIIAVDPLAADLSLLSPSTRSS